MTSTARRSSSAPLRPTRCIVAGKRFEDIKIVSTGGGAAGIACLNMLLKLGVKRENVWLCDLEGLVYHGRTAQMTRAESRLRPRHHARDARRRDQRRGPVPGPLRPGRSDTRDGGARWPPARSSLPWPTRRRRFCPTRCAPWPRRHHRHGRSDFPNQVNNVLCFPFIFRGALDVGATVRSTTPCNLPASTGIAALARATTSAEAAAAYSGETLTFGADYLIPKPFDPRLIGVVATAVAKAAMETGVATRPSRTSTPTART